jgi:acetoacetyl-CoA synthetase
MSSDHLSRQQGDLLWTPSEQRSNNAQIRHYLNWLAERGRHFAAYAALWEWSIGDQDELWSSLGEYFAIRASRP